MIGLEDRQSLAREIEAAHQAGARLHLACDVAGIECTDGVPDAPGDKEKWEDRKREYLAHLPEISDEALLISVCDKLSNARAILEDLIAIGPDVFDRFKGKKDGTLWYYAELTKIFKSRSSSQPVAALEKTVKELLTRAR